MKKMKVILFSNLFPNGIEPERGIFTFQIVQYLHKLCQLQVVSSLPFFPKFLKITFLKKWWKYSQVPFRDNFCGVSVCYPKYFIIPKLGDYISCWTLFARFYLLLKRESSGNMPDLINAHWAYPDGVVAAMVGNVFDIPVVISLLGSDINRDLQKRYFRGLIIRSLNNCKRIITVSDELKDVVVSHGIPEDKIVVINNGVDKEKFKIRDKTYCRRELGLQPAMKYILFVGRLESVKGIQILIKAIAEFRERMNGVKVVLVGEGPLHLKLKEDIEKYGVSDWFVFVGNQPHDVISKWYSAADVFCLPSLNEGHPNVVMEAIASGCPVIASDVGAIAKFVTEDVGYVFPAGDYKRLGSLLGECLEESWNPVSIRKEIENISWETTAKQYYAQFEDILKETA